MLNKAWIALLYNMTINSYDMDRTSLKTYFGLIIFLSLMAALFIFLPQNEFLPMQQLPASKPVIALANGGIMLIIYGGLGYLGLHLSAKLGFARIWDSDVSNNKRFLIPSLAGIAIGISFILIDSFVSKYHNLGALPHPPFPNSLVASFVAGIGEELLYRLFFISFWVWLFAHVLFRGKFQKSVFWIVAIASALAFSAGHLPSLLMMHDLESLKQVPPLLFGEIIFLNSALSIVAAWYLKKYGFLAAVMLHFSVDIVWHVLWGAF